MATSVKDWRRQVEPHFAFLDDYGFRIEDRFASSSFWSTRIVYARDDHGIGVDRSVEFNRAEVALLRLVDGELPTPQVWVTGAAISSILLDNVLRARDPNRFGGPRQLVGLGRQDVDNQLRELAAALREVAEDFLSRRFAAMEAGEQVIRSQLEQSPQELTVWLPDDATQDDEHQALADARATSPPEVSVVVKRYKRRPT